MPLTVIVEEWELFTLRRRRAGMTQVEVATRAQLPRPMLSAWERGRMDLDDRVRETLWNVLDQEVAA